MNTESAQEQANKIIYVLCHTHTVNEGDPDSEDSDTKQLFFSFSREKCAQQISFYRDLEGFADYPDEFEILEIELESRAWESGFFQG